VSDSYVPDDKRGLLQFLDSLEQETKNQLSDRTQQWDRDDQIACGQDWWDSGSPMFRANLIGPALEKKQALLTESKPSMEVWPRRSGLSQTGQILTRAIHAGWDENGCDAAIDDLALFLTHRGCGFWSVEWDVARDYGQGGILIRAWDPRYVQVDPAIQFPRDLDDAQYIITHDVVPVAELKARFPKAAKLLPDKGNIGLHYDAAKRKFTRGEEGQKKAGIQGAIEYMRGKTNSGGAAAVPRCLVRNYWFVDPAMKGDEMAYPNGRKIVRVDDALLNWDEGDPESSHNPYFDGRWPFVMIDQHSEPETPLGQGDVNSLRRLQEAFNRVGHLKVRVAIDNGRPILIADNNALDAKLVNRLKEAGWHVFEKMTGRDVHQQPAGVPGTELTEIMRLAKGTIDELTGIIDQPASGRGRVELRSGDQLEGLQQQGQVLLRAQARKFEQFLERVGQKWIARAFQFYTADRLFTYTGDQNKIQQYTLEVDKLRAEIAKMAEDAFTKEWQQKAKMDLAEGEIPQLPTEEQRAEATLKAVKGAWKLFRFRIVPMSSLASAKVARAQLLTQLNSKTYYPGKRILTELGFDNPDELMKEAIQELQERQMLGVPPPQPEKAKGKKA
jgi:hypothetical protein